MEPRININKKYITRNPIGRALVNNFNNEIRRLVSSLDFNNFIDVGCGEGLVIKALEKELLDKKCVGVDIDPVNIAFSRENAPFCHHEIGDIYSLKFTDNSFDLVTCLEVLEHLEEPEAALVEIIRVCNKYILLSVPREPLWRILNMVRGKYWQQFGNTPGHINHYRTQEIVALLKNYFDIVTVSKPLPWTIVLGRKR